MMPSKMLHMMTSNMMTRAEKDHNTLEKPRAMHSAFAMPQGDVATPQGGDATPPMQHPKEMQHPKVAGSGEHSREHSVTRRLEPSGRGAMVAAI